MEVVGHITKYLRRYKSLFGRLESVFFVDFGNFLAPSWIRIASTDPDPFLRAKSVRIRIPDP
jgi:hypothetical protein